MKRLIFILLAISVLLGCVSCSSPSLNVEETTEEAAKTQAAAPDKTAETAEPVQTEKDEYYPPVSDPLTPEKLAALPVATSSMTTAELRQLCLDYFYLQLTFLWTGDASFSYTIESSGKPVTISRGTVQAGIPYVTVGTGNLYRVLEYYDTATGVMQVSQFAKEPKLFGNQCSVGAFWAWGRVINSANYDWTQNMVKSRGFIPVGNYTYPDDLKSYSNEVANFKTTKDICTDNGRDVMYESYAKMQPADGLVTHSGSAGHVRMCSVAPVVVRGADGKIDPNQSYLRYRDQTSKWSSFKASDGKTYEIQGGLDSKVTFQSLFSGSYLPFTFAEFLGTDPVEPSDVTIDLAGESVTYDRLKEATVTSNYAISDVFLIVSDASGNEVYRQVKRATKASTKTVKLGDIVYQSLKKHVGGGNTVTVSCQISTGEKPVLLTAALVD